MTDGQGHLELLIREGASWIRSQRNQLRSQAAPTPAKIRELLAGHFTAATLDTASWCYVPRIENPPFFTELERQGVRIPLDFSQMAGMTFCDTVAIVEAVRLSSAPVEVCGLLFHECVHVAQYRLFGVDGFMERYVRGWADNGFDYFSIPLEREAYEFQARFVGGERFSVEESLAR